MYIVLLCAAFVVAEKSKRYGAYNIIRLDHTRISSLFSSHTELSMERVSPVV